MQDHDLFLLLLNLSQMRDRKLVVRIFTQAMTAIWPKLTLKWNEEEEHIKIPGLRVHTISGDYGSFQTNGSEVLLSDQDRQLLNNAVQMLALLLERLIQQEQLENRKAQLEQEVQTRTRELSENMDRYRALFASVSDPVLVADAETGILVECNSAAEQYFGRSRDELIGLHQHELHPSDDANSKGNTTDFQKHLEHPDLPLDVFLLTKDRDIRLASVRANIFTIGDRRFILGLFRDITEHRRDEDKIKENELRLRLALDSVKAGTWEWIKDSNVNIWSDEIWSLFGLSRDGRKPSYKLWLDAIHPMDRAAVETIVSEAVQHGTKFEVEWRVKPSRWLMSRGQPEFGPEGQVLLYRGIVMDITERKRADHALEESEKKFRLAFDSSPDAINITSLKDGRYIEINQAFTRLTGYTAEEVIGKSSFEVDLWCDPNDRAKLIDDLKRDSVCENLEAEFRLKDGGTTTALISAMVIFLNGDPHIVSITRDISKIKQIENELRRAKNIAEKANRTKSEFLANMSHEIRTPLNGILGMLQLLNHTDQTLEQDEYTHHAIESSKRLTKLLSDILDLARVEAGRLELSMESFELNDTIEAIWQLFVPAAVQKNIKFQVTVDPTIPKYLQGDPIRLQQVISNLVGNSIKFTESGQVGLDVSALPSMSTDHFRVLFSVSDTGVGIPDGMINELFEVFVQGETDFRRRFQGAGLGLSISKQLVTLMGGVISVESEVDVGTTFYISLPFGFADPVDESRPDDQELDTTMVLNILVAEDDKVNQFSIRKLLEKMGHRVRVAEHGKQVLEALRQEDFDLVTMDVQMPIMDGMEATRAIRRGDAGDDKVGIFIVAMTAYAMAGDKEKFLQAGMNDYLAKPVENAALQSVINRAVKIKNTLA